MPDIEFVLNPDGTVDIDGIGFEGNACEKIIAGYIKKIGKLQKAEAKPEAVQTKQKVGRQKGKA